MFNTFLDTKRQMGILVFVWVMVALTVFLSLFFYSWWKDLHTTLEMTDINGIKTGDIVMIGENKQCITRVRKYLALKEIDIDFDDCE